MAGYSGTPLPAKLGIRPGARIGLRNAPPGFRTLLEPWPEDAVVTGPRARELDLVVLFATTARELEKEFRRGAAALVPAGALWIGWPKKASGVATDLAEDRVREIGLAAGLVDVKVCAIDDTWSGLKFVVRSKDRPGRKTAAS